MRVHARASAALLLLSGLVPLWGGCSGKQLPPPCPPPYLTNEKRLEAGKACTRDADCLEGFCDRGICAELRIDYGSECDPPSPPEPRPPLPPGGGAWGAPDVAGGCGAYLCIDRRCRSCQSDAECGERSTCNVIRDLPGKRCGIKGDEDDRPRKPPPPPPPPPYSPPPAPLPPPSPPHP
jgi:hypothetical protein